MILLTSCKERPIVLVCLYFTATLVIAADKELGSGRVRAKIKGRSGKVEFVQKGSDGKFDYAKAFTLEVDYVKQKDEDGGDVGKAVNSLASQDFTFSALKQNAVYQSIPAVNLNLDAFLTAPEATLKLELYIFKQAGNITFGNETFLVENGTLKILIKLENYTFCEGSKIGSICKNNEVGKFVDIAIVVKSKKGKKAQKRTDADKKGKIRCLKNKKCPEVFGFDEDGEMALTKSIIVDGKTETQPSGYPRADTQGSKQRFIFRTFKFNGTAVFDPAITVGDSDDEPETPTDKALAIQLNVAMFVVMLITLFM
ncbi:skeletal aspartic acid-rich protein 2-like [Oculina patagonica]